MRRSNSPHTSTLTHTSASHLPVAPSALLDLLDLCRESKPNHQKIYQTIALDPALQLKILLRINDNKLLTNELLSKKDKLYGYIDSAFLRTLAINDIVSNFFTEKECRSQRALEKYRTTATKVANYAHAIAVNCDYAYPDEAYLAGLLHNIGQLVHLTDRAEAYTETFLTTASMVELDVFEQEWFGITSHSLGASLTDGLLTDSFLSDAILYQLEHSDAVADTPMIVRILNLACKLNTPNLSLSAHKQDADMLLNLTANDLILIQQSVDACTLKQKPKISLVETDEDRTDKTQRNIQKILSERVREFATIHGSFEQSEGFQTNANVWQDTLTNINLLFGLNRTIALEYDAHKKILTGIAGSDPKAQKMSLRVNNLGSLPAKALLDNTCLCYSAEDENFYQVADQQLLKLLDTPAFICISMQHDEIPVGVIVAGVDTTWLNSLPQRLPQLIHYASVAAKYIRQDKLHHELSNKRLVDENAYQQQKISMLAQQATNPIGIINNYLLSIKRSIAGDAKLTGQLDCIRKEMNKISDIVGRMKDI